MEQDILKKIERGVLDFSYLEIEYIKRSQFVSDKLLEHLCRNIEPFTVEEEKLVSKVYVADQITQKDIFVYKYIRYQYTYNLNNSRVSDIFDEIERFVKNETSRKELLNEFLNILKNENLLEVLSLENDYLKILLDNKIYNIISKVVRIEPTISEENKKRIKNEYPFDEYEFPPFILENIYDYPVDVNKIPLKKLLKYSIKIKNETLRKNILSRILNKQELIDLNITELEHVRTFIDTFSTNEQFFIKKELLKQHLYFDIENLGFKFDEEYQNIINDDLSYKTFVIGFGRKNFYLEKEDTVKAFELFLNKKNIGSILENFHQLQYNEKILIKEKIIELIKNEPNLYLNSLKSIYFTTDIDITNTVLMYCNPDCVDLKFLTDSCDEYDNKQRLLESLIIKQLDKADFKLSTTKSYLKKINSTKILNKLIEKNRLEDILYVYDFKKMNSEGLHIIAELIKNSDEFCNRVIDYYNLNEILINSEIVDAILFNENLNINKFIELIQHIDNNDFLFTDKLYIKYTEFLRKSGLKINFDILTDLYNKIGPIIIKYMDNENLELLLSLTQEEYLKIMALFDNKTYDLETYEKTYDVIKQHSFKEKNPEIFEIFNRIRESIGNNNSDYILYINEISKYIDNNFIEKYINKFKSILAENEVLMIKNNSASCIQFVISRLVINLNDEETLSQLHTIVDYYIECKRQEHRKTYDVEIETNMHKITDEKTLIDFLVNYCIKNNIIFTNKRDKITSLSIFNKMLMVKAVEKGFDLSLVEDIINYITDPKYELNNEKDYVISNMKRIKLIAAEIIKNNLQSIVSISSVFNEIESEVKKGKIKENKIINQKEFNYLSLITTYRIDIMKDKLLTSPELYNMLLNIMRKKKLNCIPENLEEFIIANNLSCNDNVVSAFISFFPYIYEKTIERINSTGKKITESDFSLVNILKSGEAYSAVSSVYSLVLGKEDTKLIIENPSPNEAIHKIAGNKRLNEACEWTINNFKRKYINVPPINKIYTSNDKSLKCILGNFTDPSNITHGERTGACMRIGGVGESLFEFVLSNDAGFHLRFEDPKTGKYISRVSGFRNGNTVFFNELRSSCDPELYSDNDIVEIFKILSQDLIEMTKDSEMPIENVVVHCGYATSNLKKDLVELDVHKIDEGFEDFYHDVNYNTLVMATSSKTSKFAPVVLDAQNMPKYDVCRGEVRFSDNQEEALEHVNRVYSINKLMSGKKIYEIDPITECLYAYYNDDWCIYADLENEIHTCIATDDIRALREFNDCIELLNKNKKNEGSVRNAV